MAGGGKGGGGQPQGQGKGAGGSPVGQAAGTAQGMNALYQTGQQPGAPPNQAAMDQAYKDFQAQRGAQSQNMQYMQQMMGRPGQGYQQLSGAKPPPPPGIMGGINSLAQAPNPADFMPGGAKAAPLDLSDVNANPGNATPAGAAPNTQPQVSPEAAARMQSAQMAGRGPMGGGPRTGLWGGKGGGGMPGRFGGGMPAYAQPYYNRMMGGGGGNPMAQMGNDQAAMARMSQMMQAGGTMQGMNALGNLGMMANGGIVTLPFAEGGTVAWNPTTAANAMPSSGPIAWRPGPWTGGTSAGAGGAGTGGSMFSGIKLDPIKAAPAFVAKPQEPIWSPPAKSTTTDDKKKPENLGILGNYLMGMIGSATGQKNAYTTWLNANQFNSALNPRAGR